MGRDVGVLAKMFQTCLLSALDRVVLGPHDAEGLGAPVGNEAMVY